MEDPLSRNDSVGSSSLAQDLGHQAVEVSSPYDHADTPRRPQRLDGSSFCATEPLPTESFRLSATFSAIADPTRRAILARLSKGEANVSELAEPFRNEMSLPAITKHLKVLEKAGLIQKARTAQWRTCSIRTAPLKEASAWMEQYRQYWEESLDRLGEYLEEVQQEQKRKESNHDGKPQ